MWILQETDNIPECLTQNFMKENFWKVHLTENLDVFILLHSVFFIFMCGLSSSSKDMFWLGYPRDNRPSYEHLRMGRYIKGMTCMWKKVESSH